VFDGGGNRYTITFEGSVTRDKALHLLDLVELLGGMPSANLAEDEVTTTVSKFGRVRLILERHFPIVWFSAKEVQAVFEQELREPIGLSTVATYLSRMVDRGMLTKNAVSGRRRYRIMAQASQSTPTQHKLLEKRGVTPS